VPGPARHYLNLILRLVLGQIHEVDSVQACQPGIRDPAIAP
jgi:hypothetical protein